MSKPGHNNPNTMWPRDYLVRRIRLAEYQIEIAFIHKNRKILAKGKYYNHILKLVHMFTVTGTS